MKPTPLPLWALMTTTLIISNQHRLISTAVDYYQYKNLAKLFSINYGGMSKAITC